MMSKKFYVILKKYPSLNITTVCLKFGKISKMGSTFESSDCFESVKAAQDIINHFQCIGSTARYRVVDAKSVGVVNITK